MTNTLRKILTPIALTLGLVTAGLAATSTVEASASNWCRQGYGRKAYIVDAMLVDRKTYVVTGDLKDVASLEVTGPNVNGVNVDSGFIVRMKPGHKFLADRYTTDPTGAEWGGTTEVAPFPNYGGERIQSVDEVVFLEHIQLCLK